MPWLNSGVKMPKTITIRLPDGWGDQLRAYSQGNNNTVQRQVVELIRKAVRPTQKPTPPKDKP